MKTSVLAKSLLLAGSILGAAASAAVAAPSYGLLTTIAIPVSAANNQGGALTGFDISFVDPVTGDYYFADRSNGAVDIINGGTDKVIAQAGVGSFGGQNALTSQSGPDGVVVVDFGGVATLYAGNGSPVLANSSNLLTFNVTNPASPVLLNKLSTGGTFRVDEMAFDPANKLLLVANNADTPAFATLVNTALIASPTIAHGNITIPGQVSNGGMEQSVWDPNTHTFFVSIPTFNGHDAGGVAQIGTAGNVISQYDFAALSGGAITSCASAGIALGASGNLVVGCANAKTQTVVLNPTANGGAGAIVKLIGTVSGSDELWYDPVTNSYYITGVNAAGDRVIAVVSDTDYSTLQTIDLTALGAGTGNAHSVAVDPLNGDIFVPLPGAGNDALCPLGCVAVFAPVPEPSSLPLLAFGILGMAGVLTVSRRFSKRV